MKRKKLLYVGNALSHRGKTLTHIETLSSVLREEDYEVTITSAKANKALRLTDMVGTFLKRRKQTDIVLIDTYSTANFWYAVVIGQLCKRHNIPYVPILHGGNLPYRLKNNTGSCKRLFGDAMVNVAPSKYLYSAFAKAGFDNLKLIPNHIHIENYPFKRRKVLEPKLLWVRSFADIYNPIMALQVLKELLLSYPKALLTMVGPDKDGSLERCRAIAQKEALPVTFTGLLSKEEWIGLAKNFDIFINTTDFDNTPVSIIEAMALGLPIVSTEVGGISAMIDHGTDGLLSPVKDVSQFTLTIKHLLENSDYGYKLINRARVKSEQMDWSSVKGLWNEVLS